MRQTSSGHWRSRLLSLLNEGAITLEDLDDFSDDLKDTMKYFFGKK